MEKVKKSHSGYSLCIRHQQKIPQIGVPLVYLRRHYSIVKRHRKFRTRYENEGAITARRVGAEHLFQSEIYHELITMGWWKFFGWLSLAYAFIAFFFATAYTFVDVENMQGLTAGKSIRQFLEVLLYSAQTLSTLGGIGITPVGLLNNFIFTIESVIALLGAAVITGLLYVRFSRSAARIVYSHKALIAPYRQGKALMLRIGNAKKNELMEVAALINFVNYKDNTVRKEYIELSLERSRIPYIPTTWTIVHPIDERSPFHNQDESTLQEREFDIMVTIMGIDRVTGQTVFSAHNYTDLDIVWNARFVSCIELDDKGLTLVHLDKIGEFEQLEPA